MRGTEPLLRASVSVCWRSVPMEPLTVPATLDALSLVGKFVVNAATAAGLDKRAAYRLRLAVDEIVTNTINYGYTLSETPGIIELRGDVRDDTLTIIVEDSAVAYDPTKRLPPDDLHLPPEQRRIGGLGVFLAMQSVDQLLYERVGDRNRCTFIVKRGQVAPTG